MARITKKLARIWRELVRISGELVRISGDLARSAEKMARSTTRVGPKYQESWTELLQGARRGKTKVCTEGVKIAQKFVKIMRFYSQLPALSALKKRKKCGLPL